VYCGSKKYNQVIFPTEKTMENLNDIFCFKNYFKISNTCSTKKSAASLKIKWLYCWLFWLKFGEQSLRHCSKYSDAC
jgi:hypothetical protein